MAHLMDDYAGEILEELKAVFKALPEDAAAKMAQSINAHARVFMYGAGRSGLMLRAFAMRLAQMGRSVYVVGETTTPSIGMGDLLLLASASGTTHSVCYYAETAKKARAELYVITATPDSPLTNICPVDVLLPAGSKDCRGGSSQIMGSLFEQALLIFLDAVVRHIPADRAVMRRQHANLE